MTASARWHVGPRLSRATHGEFTQESDDDDIDAQGRSRKKRRARGDGRGDFNYDDRIDAGKTAEYIPKLQAHLKTLPGGDAMAKKVAGWGVFQNGSRAICYVDLVAKKCYRTKPQVEAALTAAASA